MTGFVSVPIEKLRALIEHGRFDGTLQQMEDADPDFVDYVVAKADIRIILEDADQSTEDTRGTT